MKPVFEISFRFPFHICQPFIVSFNPVVSADKYNSTWKGQTPVRAANLASLHGFSSPRLIIQKHGGTW
jgi:hypothetical protein